MKHLKTYEKFEEPAFHGSPYEFDKFSLVGKHGVSNRHNWGYGIYFTSIRDVARYYADIAIAEDFYGNGLSIKYKGQELKELIKDWAEVYQKGRNVVRIWGKGIDTFCKQMKKSFPKYAEYFNKKETTLRYEVKKWLYDASVTSSLKLEDWESAPSVSLTKKLDVEFHSNKYSNTYKLISNKLGSDQKASEYLLNLGIDGHTYKGYKRETNWVIYNVDKLLIANKEEVGEILKD